MLQTNERKEVRATSYLVLSAPTVNNCVPSEQTNNQKHSYQRQCDLCAPFGNSPGRWLVADWKIQDLIEAICGNDANFFYTNNSTLSLNDLRLHFCSLMPSVGIQENPMLLCGYKDNRELRGVAKGINMRKINLQAIPWGRNAEFAEHVWNLSYADLPKTMAFDIDENKSPDFAALFQHYHCYQIFDALDISPPLVITINPVSLNAQFIYEMKWTDEDRANPTAAKREYDALRKRLSVLFGADPRFGNHVVRSPFYIAGHHRNNPDANTGSRYPIEVMSESLFHYSIWYQPHGYTLAELRDVVRYLEELHGPNVPVATPVEQLTPATMAVYAGPNGNKVPINEQLASAQRDPRTVGVGERNTFIFSCAAVKGRRMARTFRTADRDYAQRVKEFMATVLPGIRETNARLPVPLSEKEVKSTVLSVVRYCLSDRYRPLGRTSEEARFIALNYKWKYHVSVADKAKAMGISRRTYYNRGYHKPVGTGAKRNRFAHLRYPALLNGGSYGSHDSGTRVVVSHLIAKRTRVTDIVLHDNQQTPPTHDRQCAKWERTTTCTVGNAVRYHPPD